MPPHRYFTYRESILVTAAIGLWAIAAAVYVYIDSAPWLITGVKSLVILAVLLIPTLAFIYADRIVIAD